MDRHMGRHSTERQTCSKYWPPKYDDTEFLVPRILPRRSMFKIRIFKTEATLHSQPRLSHNVTEHIRYCVIWLNHRAQLIVSWSDNNAKVFQFFVFHKVPPAFWTVLLCWDYNACPCKCRKDRSDQRISVWPAGKATLFAISFETRRAMMIYDWINSPLCLAHTGLCWLFYIFNPIYKI